MPVTRTYPFQPKSSRSLRPGHYWAIPLDDGRYGCGVVVETDGVDVPGGVMAALLEWSGDQPPTNDDIDHVNQVLHHGIMGIKAITDCGDLVRGQRDLVRYPIELPETVSHRGGGTVWVLRGTRRVREATKEEARDMPAQSTLGFRVLQVRANARLGGGGSGAGQGSR